VRFKKIEPVAFLNSSAIETVSYVREGSCTWNAAMLNCVVSIQIKNQIGSCHMLSFVLTFSNGQCGLFKHFVHVSFQMVPLTCDHRLSEVPVSNVH